MSSEGNFDDLFLHILTSEGNIVGFFDKIFDFLYRRTDYFNLKKDGCLEIGDVVDEAETIVKNVFCKYMKQAVNAYSPLCPQTVDPDPVDYASEETVVTTDLCQEKSFSESHQIEKAEKYVKSDQPDGSEMKIPLMDPDSYNGAEHETYSWAQTLRDVDIRLKVSSNVVTGKQTRVEIQHSHLKVEVFEEDNWNILKEGDFPFKINVEESTWTLVPQENVHVCLQKIKECWWDCAFIGDPKIDPKAIDSSIAYEELDEDSQNKISELMYKEHMKRLGKPISEKNKFQDTLREAWNSEGSPFKGQPFDPSLLNITNSENFHS